jgi:hypothetical protein
VKAQRLPTPHPQPLEERKTVGFHNLGTRQA